MRATKYSVFLTLRKWEIVISDYTRDNESNYYYCNINRFDDNINQVVLWSGMDVL
jgi:hypothetical protein